MAETKDIKTKVAGVTFNNPDGSSRQVLIKKHARRGDVITLRYAPIKQDSDAVEVHVQERRGCLSFGKRGGLVQIGYLKSDLAAQLAEDVQVGSVVGKVLSVTGGTRGRSRGVNIVLRIVK